MWSLILFTMIANMSAGGGTHATVTILEFNSETSCEQAAKKLTEEGVFKN